MGGTYGSAGGDVEIIGNTRFSNAITNSQFGLGMFFCNLDGNSVFVMTPSYGAYFARSQIGLGTDYYCSGKGTDHAPLAFSLPLLVSHLSRISLFHLYLAAGFLTYVYYPRANDLFTNNFMGLGNQVRIP